MKETMSGLNGWFKTNLFQILTITIMLGNLWLASKLAPIISRVDVLETKVYALQAIQENQLTTGELEARFNAVNQRLDSIEKKLDAALMR